MKTIKKLIKKLIIWSLVENDTIELNHFLNTNKSITADGSIHAGGSIHTSGNLIVGGEIASYTLNNEEITKL